MPELDWEHAELAERARKGEVLIGVDPAVARKVFTDVDSPTSEEIFGETLSTQRLAIRAVWIFSFASIATSIGAAIWAVGWWSILLSGASLVAWAFYTGRASMGPQPLWCVGSLFGLAILACFLPDSNLPFHIWLAVVAAAFFFTRLTYALSVTLVRSLVLRNSTALHRLLDQGVVLREG